jgi:hypothetical protein
MAKETGAKRVRIEMEPFVTAWEGSTSVKEVAEKLGLKITSVMARASKYRSEYKIPLKGMQRGGGAKIDITAAKELLAKLRGVSTENIAAESQKLVVRQAEKLV